jgi:hypothetical protein
METNMRFRLILILIACLLAGCGPAATPATNAVTPPKKGSNPAASLPGVGSQTSPAPTLISPAADMGMPALTQPTGVPGSSDVSLMIEQARQDLAKKLGVPVDHVTVAGVIGNDFSNDAFYCLKGTERIARDDNMATISGQSILLYVAGRRYEYHASDQNVIFCRPLP